MASPHQLLGVCGSTKLPSGHTTFLYIVIALNGFSCYILKTLTLLGESGISFRLAEARETPKQSLLISKRSINLKICLLYTSDAADE